MTGLSDRAGDQTKKYSGGMKRRLNIGIGLLHRPKLLILDEPTVGVDPQSRNAILESVERLSATGMAVLYTTHYMEEAERLCDRVGIIDHGKLIAEGTRHGAGGPGRRAGPGDACRRRATWPRPPRRLRALPWVHEASATEDGIDLVVDDARARLPAILKTRRPRARRSSRWRSPSRTSRRCSSTSPAGHCGTERAARHASRCADLRPRT